MADARRTDHSLATENGVWVIRADVAGQIDGLNSYGSSSIVDRNGFIRQAAKQLKPDLLVAEIPLAKV